VAGAGGAVGVLLGGLLTDTLGWEWVLFFNVPIGIAAAAIAPALLGESRAEGAARGFDVAGAVAVTAGLALLIFSVVNTTTHGWGSARTLVGLAAAAVLLAAFVVRESTAREPLVRLGILRSRTLSGANIVGLLTGASLFAMFFFISLYLQQVLGASPLKAGVQYLPLAFGIFLSAGAASGLVTRLGIRPVLVTGLVLTAVGLVWFAQVSPGGSWLVDVLGPSVLVAVGLGFAFVPQTLAAVAGVKAEESGLASGLINTAQQVGGALGLAILSTLATDRTTDLLREGTGRAAAATEGFQVAFLVAAGFAVVGALVALVLVRPARQGAVEEREAMILAA
jgi:predicted MFS family arabinose efflux permease